MVGKLPCFLRWCNPPRTQTTKWKGLQLLSWKPHHRWPATSPKFRCNRCKPPGVKTIKIYLFIRFTLIVWSLYQLLQTGVLVSYQGHRHALKKPQTVHKANSWERICWCVMQYIPPIWCLPTGGGDMYGNEAMKVGCSGIGSVCVIQLSSYLSSPHPFTLILSDLFGCSPPLS